MPETQTQEKETIVIEEPAKAPEAAALPSRQDLREKEGWTDKELDAAEKRGLIAKPGEEKKPEAKASEKKEGEPETKKEPAATEGDEKPEVKQTRGTLPDFTLTPEQEKAFLAAFGTGTAPRALYFRMKNERHARQAVEAQVRELQSQIDAIRKNGAPKAEETEVDDEKPLTAKTLKAIEDRKAEEQKKQAEALQQRREAVASATHDQEEFAKSVHTDFDETVTRAQDLIKNLDAMVPEKYRRQKVINLVKQLQYAADNADQMEPEGYNAAMIAYEIGTFHPEHGKAKQSAGGEPKAKGGLSPEQIKRIEENTQRRASSASVSAGGGSRTVAAEDVTAEEFAKFDYKKRAAFREKHPQHYARLMRESV